MANLNELAALITFLKEKSINQSELIKTGQFRTPKGKLTTLQESYVSRAKAGPGHPYFHPIINHLKNHFNLRSELSNKGKFEFIIEDQNIFNSRVQKIKPEHQDLKGPKLRKQAKYEYFANTQWNMYTRTSLGVQRHVMRLLLNYESEILNAAEGKDYKGKWSFDETMSYLLVDLSHFRTRDKVLRMLFYVGTGENPSLCMGAYINTGDSGGRVVASTSIMMITQTPLPVKLISWEEVQVEGNSKDAPRIISSYLTEKSLNSISTPGKGIRSLESLTNWWSKKNLSLKDEKLRSYTGFYKVFFKDEEKTKVLDLNIYETDKQIKGELSEPDEDPMKEPVRHFGGGIATRYERTISLMCQSYGRPIYLQMNIGGPYTTDYECYSGIVTGLTYTDEELVAYPIIIVKEELLDDHEYSEANLKRVKEAIDHLSEKTIYASSPRRFLIKNL